MTRRAKLGLLGSLLFVLVNAAGGIYAAMLGEVSHTAVHGALLLLGLYLAWLVKARAGSDETQAAPLVDARLDSIQQSLDAIAVEVERVGEGQRFVTKLGQRLAEDSKSR